MARKPRRILVADDEGTSRNALRHQLVDAGYHVCTTTFGSDVILLCDLDPPDVLIMDVNLPDMDGFEVCERVRHDVGDARLTVIVMTEASDEMTHSYLGQMVEYAGGDYFFAKPCDVKLLLTLLDDLGAEEAPVSGRSGAAFPTRVTWPATARRY
ncbi:MAG: response regulator [Planctomycetota bacterium]|jgi:two-component system cell cycle response regulator